MITADLNWFRQNTIWLNGLYVPAGSLFDPANLTILLLRKFYAAGTDLFTIVSDWSALRISALGSQDNCKLIHNYKYLRGQLYLAHRADGKAPVHFVLYPHHNEAEVIPAYRAMVAFDGALVPFYNFMIDYIGVSPSSIRRGNLETALDSLFFARFTDRGMVYSKTPLSDVLTTLTYEQIQNSDWALL